MTPCSTTIIKILPMSNDKDTKSPMPAAHAFLEEHTPTTPRGSRGEPLVPLIEPGCIACGTCAFIAPEVFEVTDRSRVKVDADFERNRELIEKAALKCPVQVIKIKGEHE